MTHPFGAHLNVWKHTFPVDLHAVLASELLINSSMGKLPAACLRLMAR
jgi:hypothetical protein